MSSVIQQLVPSQKASWPVVTNFCPSGHHPSEQPCLFIHSFIYFLSSDNFKLLLFYVPGLCQMEGSIRVCSGNYNYSFKACANKTDSCSSSADPPCIFSGEAGSAPGWSGCPCTGGNIWLWGIVVQVSLFLWTKIFPEWRRETKMIDRLVQGLISSLADSLVMCARSWCVDEWQLIDSPGLGDREDETCLEKLTCCLCGTPISSSATLTHSDADMLCQARKMPDGPWAENRGFSLKPPRELKTLHFLSENKTYVLEFSLRKFFQLCTLRSKKYLRCFPVFP